MHQPQLATFSSGDFELNAEGDGVVFTANAGGVTTRNSKNPRSELREMDGGQEASWSNSAGVHELSVREAVTELPPVKPHMVTAQIHDGNDDVLQVRLEDKRLMVRYADGAESVTIDPDYRLGAVFDIDIVAGRGKVDVHYNGDLVTELPLSGEGWYFKSGAYLQSNVEKGEQADAIGKVEIYALAVRHSA